MLDYNIYTAASNILKGHFSEGFFLIIPSSLIDTSDLITVLGDPSVKCRHFMIP